MGDWMVWGEEAAGIYGHVLKASPSEGLSVLLSSYSISRTSVCSMSPKLDKNGELEGSSNFVRSSPLLKFAAESIKSA